MEKLIVLGTGYAMCTHCYNTCFAFDMGGEYLLVDAGGGNGILSQAEKACIDWKKVRQMIVTHAHCDHILGVVWVLRKIATMMKNGKYEGGFDIWCHKDCADAILTLAGLTLQKKHFDCIGDTITIHKVKDGDKAEICGRKVQFFDIHSTKLEQYGFTMMLENGAKLTCLGDEPFNPLCEKYVRDSSWILSEAFCMYADREKFKPYEKHHSTVREACQLAESLGAGSLVLWHTEDKNIARRKELYSAEGRAYYHGNLFVPDDLEVIPLS